MKLGRLLHHLIQYHLVDAADLENSFMELIQQGTQLNMVCLDLISVSHDISWLRTWLYVVNWYKKIVDKNILEIMIL